jgi:hypothetical protein
MTIKTRIFEYGNENESDAISQYGNGEKGRFKLCKATGTVLPIDEARRLDGAAESRTHANKAHGIISSDIMEPTKHPIDGKYYTSPSKFREVTKAHGYDEIGTAYENGYNPEAQAEREFKQHQQEINKEWKQRWAEK